MIVLPHFKNGLTRFVQVAPIQIRVKLLTTDLAEGLVGQSVQAHNMSALALAARLRERFKDEHCPEHPVHEGSVVIVAQLDGSIHIDKTQVCCQTFGGTIVPL